ncbi:phosphoglycerate mutase family [Fusarium napiforme]|uniref:Phosphoglycerate mutase family n=1 Tax=Fusarium napiforme TaxID=42672 RepID=A0A8H5K0I8_9HYPO|nr:phosphoglycerate mutase family [Fusarium napiforme]
MAPTIHLVRHAQGFHNLSIENEQMQDPDLTPLGEEQCAALRKEFPHHDKLTKLFASPMRRTVYTCLHAFGTDELKPIVTFPVFQEVSANPCDIGSPVAKVQSEFEGIADYSNVEESWTDKGPDSEYEPTLEKLTARGLKARKLLRDRMTGTVYLKEEATTGWSNCEYRSYQFVDPTGKDDDAALLETEESWQRRQGNTKPPTLTELRQVKSVVQKQMAPYLNLIMPN